MTDNGCYVTCARWANSPGDSVMRPLQQAYRTRTAEKTESVDPTVKKDKRRRRHALRTGLLLQ